MFVIKHDYKLYFFLLLIAMLFNLRKIMATKDFLVVYLASLSRPFKVDESLVKGHTSPCAAWICLNRLRTGVACSKEMEVLQRRHNM